MPSLAEVEQFQAAVARLSSASVDALASAWPEVDPFDTSRVAALIRTVGETYGYAAATMAADWYESLRADAGASGSYSAELVADLPRERATALARWGTEPLYRPSPDAISALSLISGGLQRMVANAARDTITTAALADDGANGWARHASPNACAFCAMLATRGAVYKTQAGALSVTGVNLGGTDYWKMRRTGATREGILRGSRATTIDQGGRKGRATKRPLGERYHDHCHCVAIPVFGTYEPAPYVAGWRQVYADSKVRRPGGAIDTKATLAEMRSALGTH